MSVQVTKAVFPVAGLGSRFLPATKANPKEMLPIVDKPLIQYAVEEAAAAGITQMIFVTSSNKRAIEDHFDHSYELEQELEKRGNTELLKVVRDILPKGVSCAYVRQPQALGLGHAVWCAKEIVGAQPFAVVLADDLIDGGDHGCLTQMTQQYRKHACSMVAVEEVPASDTDKYGIVNVDAIEPGLGRVTAIVEKPAAAHARSTLAVVGRYILSPQIFSLLESQNDGAQGEIQLTDAIARLLQTEQVLAYQFTGKRYDCGSKLGYLEATVAYGLRHPQLGKEFSACLNDYCANPKAAS
ncbi:MAG: UTP--glucose-1-phosphate uridylyltransferase GalU [Gammaproteobacteria bacterium]|nr:UTP--glucose-1-phosphate uridylyltransferase GalU [Gammaproteobacteria bacterium]